MSEGTHQRDADSAERAEAPAAQRLGAPGAGLPARLLQLQRTAGNRAVGRMLRSRRRVLQRAAVTAVQGRIPQEWLNELFLIVQAAENSLGSTFRFNVPERFTSAEGPKSSQATYALGGSYFERTMPGGQTLRIIGPSSAFGTERYATSVNSSEWLGNRASGMHGEMALIEAKGLENVSWTHATQDNCLFCHGYLELNNIQHQGLRPDPWPQMWRHPLGTFKLAAGDAVLGNVVDIEFNGQHRRYQIFPG